MAKRKKNISQAITVGVSLPPSVAKNPGSKRKTRKRRKNKSKKLGRLAGLYQGHKRGLMSAEENFFKEGILRPDLTGPFRIPRPMSNGRTSVGETTNKVVFTPTGPAFVNGYQLSPTYSNTIVGTYYVNLATTATALGAGGSAVPDIIWPATSFVYDANFVAGVLEVYCIGSPTNTSGEIIFGTAPSIDSTATYNSLFNYPGVQAMPLAELINHRLYISARQISAESDNFLSVGSTQADVDQPFFFVTGCPNTVSFTVFQTSIWELRSKTPSGGVIPFENDCPAYAKDIAAFQDAYAEVADMPVPAMLDQPQWWENYASAYFSSLGVGAIAGAAGLIQTHRNRRLSAARQLSLSQAEQGGYMGEEMMVFNG